jgi:glycosyltransferase involved in cell wall biosynthesis
VLFFKKENFFFSWRSRRKKTFMPGAYAACMIHFFPIFSRRAADTEFGAALRRIGIAHRIFAGEVRFNYRSRAQLLLVCIPRLALFALGAGARSLFLARPFPDAVVLGSDVEVLVFSLLRAVRLRRVPIVLGSFIYTTRASGWQNRLRHAFFGLVLARASIVVVHSRLEAERYAKIFARSRTRFVFVPWGTTIDARARLTNGAAALPGQGNIVVAAGKSSRDYRTLIAAVAGTDAQARIICDCFPGDKLPQVTPNVTLLRDCHGEAYLRELANAAIVVVPLTNTEISAGQMVLIQAMGLGKAIIVSDTPTIRDYVTAGHDAVLVPQGNAAALRDAIAHLLTDPAWRERLGRNASTTFDKSCSTEAHLRALIAAAGHNIRSLIETH